MNAISDSAQVYPLVRLDVRFREDLLLARQRTRLIAGKLGFDALEEIQLAAALSEVLRHAFHEAGGGTIRFSVETDRTPLRSEGHARQILVIVVEERGARADEHATSRRLAISRAELESGLGSVQRLLDDLSLRGTPGALRATLRKRLPAQTTFLSPTKLQEIGQALAEPPEFDPAGALQVQNQELLRTLGELREREEELTQVNQELTATNTGVLALYDELDTLHRVGLMLAERHDLHDLLQTIINATTELTGAEFGVFYHFHDGLRLWRRQATAGPERALLSALPAEHPAGFFGEAFEAEGAGAAENGDSLEEAQALACARWGELFRPGVSLASCLVVPVRMANQELAGALAFGHRRPEAFSERSERIVSAIALQAAVGIEKARLFHGLQAASEAKDRFLAMLSHELRTPLNPVLVILSSLHGDPALPENLREDVTVMRRNIELEARLIDDLLDFNRIIRGKLELQRQPVEVQSLVQAVVEICRPELQGRHHQLRVQWEAGPALVSGDAARLQQVLWNLLKNAIKFTPAGGRISVRGTTEQAAGQEYLLVEVEDTGSGIAPELLPTIFSAFDQGSLQPGQHGGLGLGLTIARTFIDLHGGTLSARSGGRGEGATFTIRLPLLAPAAERGHRPSAAAPAPAQAATGRRLLVVDDHQDTLRTLTRLLERRGHHVLAAGTCAEALALASSEAFDLVISDLGLPDRSGLELVSELRRIQSIPAIALSGYGMEGDVANSQAAGFDRHLTKPVDFPLLEKAISELLRT